MNVTEQRTSFRAAVDASSITLLSAERRGPPAVAMTISEVVADLLTKS